MKHHQKLLTAAIERDGDGQRALLAGDLRAARAAFASAADLYRQSWAEAPAHSYGRLVGMLKATVLSGDGAGPAADYVCAALSDDSDVSSSPTGSYALALAALIASDDQEAVRRAARMRDGSESFDRTATAIAALAGRHKDAYASAVEEIVRDFEQRSAHLTGVAIADTALVLECLAAARGLAAGVRSDVLPG